MNKNLRKIRKIKRVRGALANNKGIPRLSVFRSNKNIWAQLIDDNHGKTLVAASTKTIKEKLNKTEKATKLGEIIAKLAIAKNILHIRFDRGVYKYHGRVKALSEAARSAGLKF